MKTTYPAPSIIDGVTDASTARDLLSTIAKGTNGSEYLTVGYDSDYSQLYTRADMQDGNMLKVAATVTDGVFCQSKTAEGSWTTVPTVIARGGTGATTAADARTNLELNPVAISITAASGVTWNHNESFKIGKVGFLTGQITITADNVSTLGTIAAGSRPVKNFYGNMMNETETSIVAIAVNTSGNVITGSGYTKNKAYRFVMIYWIA